MSVFLTRDAINVFTNVNVLTEYSATNKLFFISSVEIVEVLNIFNLITTFSNELLRFLSRWTVLLTKIKFT